MGNSYIPFPPSRTDQCKQSFPAMVAPAGPVAGNGSPEGVVIGNPGMRYRDLDNDDAYLKIAGNQTVGWLLVGKWADTSGGSSTSGSGTVTYSAVDPTGVLSITGPGICLGTGAFAGYLWTKATAATSSADWVLVLS